MKQIPLAQSCRIFVLVVFFLVGSPTLPRLAYGLHSSTNHQEKKGSGESASGKGRETLRKAVEAAGGLKKFKSINNFMIKTEGVISSPITQKKITLNVTETILLPDRTKQVFEVPGGARIHVLNGNSSWQQIGTEAGNLPDAQAREMKRGLFRDTINIFKMCDSKELRVDYISEENVAGKRSHVLQIKNQSGDFFNLYVDAESYLVRKKSYRGAAEVGLATLEEVYSDYRKVDGIIIPFRTLVRANGKQFIKSEVVSAQLNIEIARDFFARKLIH